MTPRIHAYATELALKHGTTASVIVASVGPGSQGHPAAAARRELMGQLRLEGFSTNQIGLWFGIDHSTVSYWTGSHRGRGGAR
jgi:hypothetical protein